MFTLPPLPHTLEHPSDMPGLFLFSSKTPRKTPLQNKITTAMRLEAQVTDKSYFFKKILTTTTGGAKLDGQESSLRDM